MKNLPELPEGDGPVYILYNKKLENSLTHPKIGIWYASTFDEAYQMLLSCLEYVDTLGIHNYDKEFVIVNLETGEECQLPTQAKV